MSHTWVVGNKSYQVPSETGDLRKSLSETLPSKLLDNVIERAKSDPDLWVVRAVVGASLPMPMTFELLSKYLADTGKGTYSEEELEKLFVQQMSKV